MLGNQPGPGVSDGDGEPMADGTYPMTMGPEAHSAETALMERLQRGDARAFEQLVRSHQHRVFDFCYRMLGDREEANDIAQDVFISVHQNLAGFRRDAKLTTWIFRISKNHCLNRIKYLARRGSRRREDFDLVDESRLAGALEPPPSPDRGLVAEAEKNQVQAAIAQLEPEQRLLVALRDIEGLSYEEIVEITELPVGTVKSRLHRARERLAELLGEGDE